MQDAIKRAVDVGAATLVLVLLSPVLVVVALLVRVRLGTPVLFRQVRPGRHEVPFTLLKFRTMLHDVANAGQPSDEQRLTRLGRMLRRTSLDELPELWNVVRGDMSLVGPRPLLMEYLPRYSVAQRRRHEVRPGITGWAQVNGRNALDWADKFRLDVWYVEHRSLGLDLRILARTVATVFTGGGVTRPGMATMEPFLGDETPHAPSTPRDGA